MTTWTIVACGGATEETQPEEGVFPTEIVMGFVPTAESDQIAGTVEPLATRLSEILEVPVRGEVMTNFSALVEGMGSGQIHIGFLPGFGYVQGNERYGLEVILKSQRNGSDSYRAQFVVRADSGIEKLEDLRGKVWAFPDVASPAGYLFPAAHIVEKLDVTDVLNDFFEAAYQTGSHDNALITVYNEEADVATTYEDARPLLENEYPDVMETLKILDYTGAIPNDTISIIPELNEELKEKIKQAFLSFNGEPEMIQVMNEVYRWDGIMEAEDSDYDIVRETYNLFRDEINLD